MRYPDPMLTSIPAVANRASFAHSERLAMADPLLSRAVRTGHMEWQDTVGRCTYAAVRTFGPRWSMVAWMVFDREGGARFVAELVPADTSASGTVQVYSAAASGVVLVTDSVSVANRALRALPRAVVAMRTWETLAAAELEFAGVERMDSVLGDEEALAEAADDGDRLMLQVAAVELRDALLLLAATGGCEISIH